MNKCFISSLKELENELEKIGQDKFIIKYKQCELFVGDYDAIKFIENILKNN